MRIYLYVLIVVIFAATVAFYTGISSAQVKHTINPIVLIPAILALPLVAITIQIIAGFLSHTR